MQVDTILSFTHTFVSAIWYNFYMEFNFMILQLMAEP